MPFYTREDNNIGMPIQAFKANQSQSELVKSNQIKSSQIKSNPILDKYLSRI